MLIKERVDRVLREQLGGGYEWDQNTPLVADGLGLDSLDVVELIVRLENEFKIAIPDDDITTIEQRGAIALQPQYDRVRDVVAYLEGRLAKTPALFG